MKVLLLQKTFFIVLKMKLFIISPLMLTVPNNVNKLNNFCYTKTDVALHVAETLQKEKTCLTS